MSSLFQMVILAGGLATRLHPVSKTIPKSLIDVNGEPFIAHQLRLLAQKGIREIVLCIGYLGEQIIEKVGNGNQYGVHVGYSWDGPSLLGTAGAIKNALPLLNDTFFVLYGDSYLPCDYKDVQAAYLKHQKLALMTLFKNCDQWDTSNIVFINGEILIYDKNKKTQTMNYIDYGLGVFNKNVFDQVPSDIPYDLALLYQDLLSKQQLSAFEVSERFYEVGSCAGIQGLERYLSTRVPANT